MIRCVPLPTLRGVIAQSLRGGKPSLTHASGVLGLSARSLQRQLAGRGLSFSHLVDEVRYMQACELLAQGELRLYEIARRLGYANAGSFTRAFERWADMTPSRYRRLAREARRCGEHKGLRPPLVARDRPKGSGPTSV